MKACKKEPFSILRLHVLMKIPILLFRSHIHYGQSYDTHISLTRTDAHILDLVTYYTETNFATLWDRGKTNRR